MNAHRRLVALVFALGLCLCGTAAAYGGFYNAIADGTIIPTPATAHLTCYVVDSGFTLASANTSRRDILATFTQRTASGDTKVCFLRPPALNGGDWDTAPVVATVPAYDTSNPNWNGTGMTEAQWRARYPTR